MMKTRMAAVALAIAVGAAVGVPPLGPQGAVAQPRGEGREDRVDLRPRFSPGQQIRYTMEIDSTTDTASVQMPELDGKQNLRQEITFVFRVVEAGSEGSTIEMVYERVKVDLDSEGFKASYDSARPAPPKGTGSAPRERTGEKTRRSPPRDNAPRDNDPDALPGDGATPDIPTLADMSDDEMLAAAMGGIAGTVVTIELDTAGNITAVRGTESLSGGGSGLGGMLGAAGGGGLGGVPAPSKGASGPWSISSPGQSGFARVGETWSTTSSLGNTPLGAFEMVTRYTLRSAAGGRATIAINGGIEGGSDSGAPGGGGAGGGGAQIREARYSGQCIWDTGEGQLREMTTTQSATMEGSGLGVPMTMKSKTDMRVRRVR